MDSAWHDARNLLCIRLDAVGDVLMTTPAIRALRAGRRDRRITLLGSPTGADIAALVPEIDEVIAYSAPWMKATPARTDPTDELGMAERLRQHNFDGAVIFTVYSQSPLPAALLCYLAGIPRCLAHCHENPYQLISEWVPDPEPKEGVRHEVRRQLDLVAAIGCRIQDERLVLRVPEASREEVLQWLSARGMDGATPWAVIHPGATAPSRRYPAEGFAVAAGMLKQRYGWEVVFTGSAGEIPLIESIRAAMAGPSHSLAGMLSLRQLAALIALAPVLIVNNTGPAHIAAALGTPVVDLYALTNLQHTPWQVTCRLLYHDVPCRSCYKSICPEGHQNCLRLVSPEQVVEAALAIHRRRPAPAEAVVG